MTHAIIMAILLALYLPPLPVPSVTIRPRVLPEYRCDRYKAIFCELTPAWRIA